MMKETIFILASFLATNTFAAEYFCPVSFKQGRDVSHSLEQLQKYQFSVNVNHIGNEATISRCSSATSIAAVTCDDYEVDFIDEDPYVGHKKYYYFRGQLDVQIFNDLSFVENNGRGIIAFGKCLRL
jgi:hypothetical protein